MKKVVILPGEAVTFILITDKFGSEETAERAEVTISEYRTLTEPEAKSSGNMLTTRDLFFDTYEITADGGPVTLDDPFVEDAKLSGTLVNDGEAIGSGMIVCVVYDAQWNFIVADTFLIRDIPEGSETAYAEHFRTAVTELPGYDHASFYMFVRQ